MKTVIKFLTFSFLLIFVSCHKVKDNFIEKLLTFEEAAETIETLLNSSNCGLMNEMESLAQISIENYEFYESDCEYGVDTSFICSNSEGIRSWDYSLNYSWSVICDDLKIPQMLEFISSKTGDFNSTRFTQSGQSGSSFQLTNLSPIPIGTNFVLNGTHNYVGTQELFIRNKSLSLTVSMELMNVEIAKTNYEIMSGEGDFNIVAESGEGNTEMTDGSIVFLGNGQAQVTINGEIFMISI